MHMIYLYREIESVIDEARSSSDTVIPFVEFEKLVESLEETEQTK